MEWMVKPKANKNENMIVTDCFVDCNFFCPVKVDSCSELDWCLVYNNR